MNTELISKIALLVVVFIVVFFNIRKMNRNMEEIKKQKEAEEKRIRELRLKQEEENKK